MKITADYHTHTIYSHGKGTIRENVEAARKKGLSEIAICDHGPGHIFYGVRKGNLFKMRREINKLNEEYSDIKILLGLEANVIGYDGYIDVDEDILEIIDILLLGFHYGIIPRGIKSMYYFYILNPISKVLSLVRKRAVGLNTNAVIKAIEKYPIDVITHPGSKARLDIERLAKTAYEHSTALEINSHHGQLSIEGIEEALKTDVEFIINSDAHHPDDVGDFQMGIERALKAKVPIDRIRNAKDNMEV